MKTLTKEQLIEKASEVFKRFPKEGKLIVASDGQCFLEKSLNAAKFHARNSKAELHEISRADLSGTKKTDPGAGKSKETGKTGSVNDKPKGTGTGEGESGTPQPSEFDSLTVARMKDDLSKKGVDVNQKALKPELYELWKEHCK